MPLLRLIWMCYTGNPPTWLPARALNFTNIGQHYFCQLWPNLISREGNSCCNLFSVTSLTCRNSSKPFNPFLGFICLYDQAVVVFQASIRVQTTMFGLTTIVIVQLVIHASLSNISHHSSSTDVPTFFNISRTTSELTGLWFATLSKTFTLMLSNFVVRWGWGNLCRLRCPCTSNNHTFSYFNSWMCCPLVGHTVRIII